MNNNGTKISIITATWNCQDVLSQCLSSIKSQNYENREHIIIDGKSNDGTIELINSWIKEIDVFVSESDKGIYDALNKGIKLATGDVIGFLHADDLYQSEEVLSTIAKIFEDKSISAVYGDLIYVNRVDISKIIRKWNSKKFKKRDLYLGWMPPHPTLYVRKEWYEKIGGFNIDYKISADYLSILNLFMDAEFKAQYLPEVLIKMRVGGASNRSIKAIINKSIEDWLILRSMNFSLTKSTYALIFKNLQKINQLI